MYDNISSKDIPVKIHIKGDIPINKIITGNIIMQNNINNNLYRICFMLS